MKESYVEGIANYCGPESCVHIRKDVGEALPVESAGRVSSREIDAPRREAWVVRGALAVGVSRRSHHGRRNGETFMDLVRSETPCMRESTLRGNREVPESSAISSAERIGKPSGVRR